MFGEIDDIFILSMGNSIPSCKEDVNRLSNIFQSKIIWKKFDIYPKEEIIKFIHSNNIKKDDLLIIHFSGHGEYVGRKINNKIELISTWVNSDKTYTYSDEICQILSQLVCKIFLISDACHSGDFAKFYNGNSHFLFISSSGILNESLEYGINNKSKSGLLINLLEHIISLGLNFFELDENMLKGLIINFCKIYRINNNIKIFYKKK